jgi:putative ABC transport system permease protein
MLRDICSELRYRLRALFRRNAMERELDEEVGLHLERETEKLVARGLSVEEARRSARLAFGPVEATKEATRDARGVRLVEHLVQDLRYAARSLRKTPGFTVTIVLVLALGVGANAAMFTLVDRLFFREPSGITDPTRVLEAFQTTPSGFMPSMRPALLPSIRRDLHGLAEVAVRRDVYAGLDVATAPRVTRVTSNYFGLLGVRPARGRFFTTIDGADSLPVAVVSDRYWQRDLSGDPNAVGRSIELNRKRYTVIGVAPAAFAGIDLQATDVWLPMAPDAGGTVVLRLANGVTSQRVDAVMTLDAQRGMSAALLAFRKQHPFPLPTVRTSPLPYGRLHPAMRNPYTETITRVTGVAAIILLIAVANVATLLLMRAARRQREIAIRLALGVSRARLCGQLFAEGAMLAVAGGGAALLLGTWGSAVARARLLPGVRLTYALFDWRLVGFTLTVAVTAGLFASLASALQATRADLTRALKAGADEGHAWRSWLRSGLIVAQTALSVVLLVGAGLFVQSLRKIRAVPLGIDVGQLMFAKASFDHGDSGKVYLPLMEEEVSRLAAMPGVHGVAVSLMPPMQGETSKMMFRPSGDTVYFNGQSEMTGNAVGPGYFATVGMRVLDGRDFASTDIATSTPVLVINRAAALAAWPGRRAVGECLVMGRPTNPCATVVGVVTQANLMGVKPDSEPHYYVPVAQQRYQSDFTITLRAPLATRVALVPIVRRDLMARLPSSTTIQVENLAPALARLYIQWQEGADVFVSMGLLALVVAGIGMYSVIGYAVSRRMREMGVRVALGARRPQLMGPLLLGSVRSVLVGIVLGIAAALALGRLVASLLYDTSPRDPAVIVGAAVMLVLAALAAALGPAWRASRVDPASVLRAE